LFFVQVIKCNIRRVWRYQREVIRICKSKKNTQHNFQKKKDTISRTPLQTGGELRCPGRVSSSCFTSYKPGDKSWMGKGPPKCLRQVEHIRGHLWHRCSVMINQLIVATVKLSKWWLILLCYKKNLRKWKIYTDNLLICPQSTNIFLLSNFK
jgi:hypothetical protein